MSFLGESLQGESLADESSPAGLASDRSVLDVVRERPGRMSQSASRRRYLRYRRSEVLKFISLVPQEGIRPLYRGARAWAASEGCYDDKDPLAMLVAFVDDALPLPPFERWAEDFYRNPLDYLRALDEDSSSEMDAPIAVDSKTIQHRGADWDAWLNVFSDHGAWRGFIAFHGSNGGGVRRTTDIFLERDPETILERFSSLDSGALSAFLQSVLP